MRTRNISIGPFYNRVTTDLLRDVLSVLVLIVLFQVLGTKLLDWNVTFGCIVFGLCILSSIRVSQIGHILRTGNTQFFHEIRSQIGRNNPQNNTALHLYLAMIDRDFGENDYEMLLALDDNCQEQKGASKSQIKSLRTEFYDEKKHKTLSEYTSLCSICLETIKNGEGIKFLSPCPHFYHVGCIDKWLALKTNCPICKSDVQLSMPS